MSRWSGSSELCDRELNLAFQALRSSMLITLKQAHVLAHVSLDYESIMPGHTGGEMRLLATILLTSTIMIAQQPAQDHAPTGGQKLRGAAVGEVRALNTAEMRYRGSHGRFADLEELKSSDDWKTTIERAKYTGAEGPEFIASYDTSVIADAQGKTYRISVKPKNGMCQSNFFSDESGVIFEGIALGCGSEAANGGQ